MQRDATPIEPGDRPGTKFSPVEAARLALHAQAGPSTTSRDRILAGAALLWCRHLAIPSVRDLGTTVRRSPSVVLRPFGRLVDLYAEVIRLELDRLDVRWFGAHPRARPAFIRAHVAELHARDPVLLRLPGLVLGAVAGAGRALPPRLTVPWFSVAAFADDPEPLELSA